MNLFSCHTAGFSTQSVAGPPKPLNRQTPPVVGTSPPLTLCLETGKLLGCLDRETEKEPSGLETYLYEHGRGRSPCNTLKLGKKYEGLEPEASRESGAIPRKSGQPGEIRCPQCQLAGADTWDAVLLFV